MVQHGKSVTRSEHKTKKVQHEKSTARKKCNMEKCNTKSVQHEKISIYKSVIWKKYMTKMNATRKKSNMK